MITVRTTLQPDRDTEVGSLAELKDLARQGLIVEESLRVDEPRGNRTSAATGDK